VSRLLRILIRNAPLYLAAVVAASVLYAGLVFSQNVRVWPGPVPIQPFGQASSLFLLDVSPQAVTSIRFVAPGSVAASVSGQSFRATVDLSGLTPPQDGAPLTVAVKVEALDPQIQVTGWSPTFVSVRLDPIRTRNVPVRVDRGAIPEGLAVGDPQVDVATATVRGPASVVDRVAAAVARVNVDASGVDVDQQVDLMAVDARGDRLTPVDFEPRAVHVRIEVSVAGTTRTVPIVAVLRGNPAAGYALGGITVDPLSVVIVGPRDALEAIDRLETAPLDVAGARANVSATVAIVLPEGVTLQSGTPSARVTVSIVPLSGSATYTVAIVLAGTSTDLTYGLSTGSTLAVISGPLALLGALDGSSLRATADVSGLGPGTHTVTLTLSAPTGLAVASLSPAQVVVTVGTVATPTPTPAV
jgi:YbbR domain-containing protein